MKKASVLIILFIACLRIHAQDKEGMEYFPLWTVRLLEGPFKHAEELDKKYLLELNPDRLLAPFLREAGLPQKAESYGNWENTGLDGHIGGHYLSALALMYASTGDVAIRERLSYMVHELNRCQQANGDGYLGGVPGGKVMWKELAAGKIKAGSFDLNGKWVPLYNIHKTYAGLRDAYLHAGDKTAKDMLIKMADWAVVLVSQLSEEQIQEILKSEHGGLNEIFADVYAITGNEKYLKLAHQFSHQQILAPLLENKDQLTGLHANTQIPKVLGFKRIADLENNEAWANAAQFFWETVVKNRSVSIGGNSVGEHFNPVDDFSKMLNSVEGPETCNSYNMLKLSKMLYQSSHDEKYIAFYERVLYNHILSTQNPNTGGFVYFTPMRPGHYRVYSQPQTSFWCCVGSGLENHAKYGEMIYAHQGNNLYVNLFIPSALQWDEKGVSIKQETSFPDESKTTLTVSPNKEAKFTIFLRYPQWVNRGDFNVTINGTPYPIKQTPGSYVALERTWRKGDKIIVEMPMQLSAEQLLGNSPNYTFLYGPIALAAKTDTADQLGLFADDSRGGHIAKGKQIPLQEMPLLVSNPDSMLSLLRPIDGKPLTFHLKGLAPKKFANGMELTPFFRVAESRYILYWPQATTDKAKTLFLRMEEEERKMQAMERITLDKVICGEQQPESDHTFQSEDSWTGYDNGLHWRQTKSWFSYQFINKSRQAKYLYVQSLKSSNDGHYDVMINGKRMEVSAESAKQVGELAIHCYPLPRDLSTTVALEIKFVAVKGSVTSKITQVRLTDRLLITDKDG
ncbi:glycoside hydrolase family 127 protein [Olivibacter domesticus]|uniref:Uncharacterized protein n=1 Tax=Olivibacter domesticus TaxID=407022 RepID=A0A1H7MME9_OLID1|nr:glycoside hydrolase family 127 protein [Olivibacter domesticus]SEL12038.1 hypothetical protein SAMN05661044_02054 [Olivibacter domesticus]